MKIRMKITAVLVGLVLSMIILIGGCATGQGAAQISADFSKIDKIGIVDIVGDVQGDAAKNQIADYFAMELLKKGFTPVERSQIQSLLKEQQFQAMDVTSTEGAARAGRILNVPTVLVANVDYGEKMTMTAKLINVEDGSILWIGSGSGKTGRGLIPLLGATAGAVTGVSVAGESTESKVGGAVAGGILGGVAGELLTPQQSEQAQKVIAKMCETLPYKFPPPPKKR